MLKKKSLKINAIMNALLTISSVIFPLITFPYVSRILSPIGIGKVSFATSVVAYFNLFAQLGIPTYGIKACAKVRDNKLELTRIAHELLFLNIIMSLLSYVTLIGFITFVPKIGNEKMLYFVLSSTILFSTIGMEWLYKGLEEYTYITARSVIFKIIALVAMFLLIRDSDDYIIYAGTTVIASSASLILNFKNIKKYIYLKLVGPYDLARHIKPILIFFAMACATTIYVNLDSVMLGFFKSDSDVGYYNVAVKIRTVLLHIVTSLGAVLLPRAAYYIENNLIDEFYRIIKKAINFVILISFPLCIYFILFSRESIIVLAGKQYLEAVVPMKIIMVTLIFAGISNVTGVQMLVPLGKEKFVLYSEILGAIVDLILNTILIPCYASAGAAIGTLAAEIIVFLYQLVILRKYFRKVIIKRQYLKIFMSNFIAAMGAYFVGYYISNSLLKLIITGVVFFILYVGILLATKEDMVCYFIRQIITKIKN